MANKLMTDVIRNKLTAAYKSITLGQCIPLELPNSKSWK